MIAAKTPPPSHVSELLEPTGPDGKTQPNLVFWVLFVIGFFYAFLLALELLSVSCGMLAGSVIDQVVRATANPAAGVCIGLLVTATIQSSSAVTSILVALVSASALSLEQAVPIVMGANVGTTFTAALVSMSHLSTKKEFRKGFAAAMLHVLFNVGACLLLFPLEYYFHFLSRASRLATHFSGQIFEVVPGSPALAVSALVSPIARRLVHPGSSVWFWAAIALVMLFSCIFLFRTFLKVILIGDLKNNLDERVFSSPLRALGLGAGLTAFIHSSTITTSLCVPLAATNKMGVRKLFPFIIGANIGTTVTALIAAVSRSEAAIALAFSHFLFNTIAAGLIYPWPQLKGIIIQVSRSMARGLAQQRLLALIYLLGFFFVLPLLVIYLAER